MNRIIAFILFILLLPVLMVCFIMIGISDGWPILFRQNRIGRNSKIFTMYKFRTMKKDTPDIPTHLMSEPDKFIIKSVKWMRILSLDELPNIINIINGEMNFIGPRPALYNQADLIALRQEKQIDTIKPGITGWAQVNGRDEIEIPAKVALDEYYLKNRNLKLDLKILFMTFNNVIKKKQIKH